MSRALWDPLRVRTRMGGLTGDWGGDEGWTPKGGVGGKEMSCTRLTRTWWSLQGVNTKNRERDIFVVGKVGKSRFTSDHNYVYYFTNYQPLIPHIRAQLHQK